MASQQLIRDLAQRAEIAHARHASILASGDFVDGSEGNRVTISSNGATQTATLIQDTFATQPDAVRALINIVDLLHQRVVLLSTAVAAL